MKATTITSNAALLQALRDLAEWSEDIWMAFAWATAQGGKAEHWRALPLHKVRRAVIGTSFSQTEPWALEELGKVKERLRVVPDSDEVFHPKVILGRRGSKMRAIVGSANFTTAAYSKNAELNLFLKGLDGDPELRALKRFIDKQFEAADPFDPAWLPGYVLAWKAARRRRHFVPGSPLVITSPDSLDMSWAEFVSLIEAQDGRPLEKGARLHLRGVFASYQGELDRAQAVLSSGKPFARLLPEERMLLIGVGRLSCGLLGHMGRAISARTIVSKRPEVIGRVLDRLPLTKAVSKQHLADIVHDMLAIHGVGLAVGSRLLTAKRPDLFVSANKGSNKNLSVLLGMSTISSSEHYMELLERVWSTEWYRSGRPTSAQARSLWSRRAAMLDAAVYVPTPAKKRN